MDWVELLDSIGDLIAVNEGVSLAPPLIFPHHSVAGSLTSVTDATVARTALGATLS